MTKRNLITGLILIALGISAIFGYNYWQNNNILNVKTVEKKLVESVVNDSTFNFGKDKNGNTYNPIELSFDNGTEPQEIIYKSDSKGRIKIIIVSKSGSSYSSAGARQYEFDNNTNLISRTVSFSISQPDYKTSLNIIKIWNDLSEVKDQDIIQYGSYVDETREQKLTQIKSTRSEERRVGKEC